MRTVKPKITGPIVVNVKRTRGARSYRSLSSLVLLVSLAMLVVGVAAKLVVTYHNNLISERDQQTAKLESANQKLFRAREAIAASETSNQSLKREHDSLITLHLDRLSGFAEYITENPSKANQVFNETIRFADKHNRESDSIRKRLELLPKPKALDSATDAKILGASFTPEVAIVDLDVFDASHAHIPGLGRVDFEVVCRGKVLPSVRVQPATIAVGEHRISVLLDCSRSIADRFDDSRQATRAFVTELANPWKLKICSFASEVRSLSPWSQDPSVHIDAIDSLVADGGTELFAAMEVDAKEHGKFQGTQTTVILTDGKDSRGTGDLTRILALYKRSEIKVHILALDGNDIDEPVLRRIAQETNGSFQKISQSQELTASFKALATRMKRPIYRLTILGPIERESLSVKVAGQTLPVPSDASKLVSTKPIH